MDDSDGIDSIPTTRKMTMINSRPSIKFYCSADLIFPANGSTKPASIVRLPLNPYNSRSDIPGPNSRVTGGDDGALCELSANDARILHTIHPGQGQQRLMVLGVRRSSGGIASEKLLRRDTDVKEAVDIYGHLFIHHDNIVRRSIFLSNRKATQGNSSSVAAARSGNYPLFRGIA